MENFDLLKEAADGMLGKMIQGQGNISAIDFNVDLAGKGYKVYYERKAVNEKPMWVLTDWKQIGG